VVTLAGLLFFEGVLIELATIDKQAVGGVISVSTTSPIFKLVNANLSVAAGWIGLVVVIAIYAAVSIRRAARRRAEGLTAPPLSVTLFQIGAAAVGGILLVYVCNENRGLLTPLKGVPYVVPFVGLVLLVYSIFLGRTRLGRYMYAIGGNPEAARRAGISVQRVRRLAFVFSAMTAGLAGLVYASTLGSVSTGVDGGTYTLYAVAAAVIGGASLFGGRGTIFGTAVGVMIPAVLNNGLVIINVQPFWQTVAIGAILIVAVALDNVRRSREMRGS
jgi:D-xylose transport system permease protein